MERLFLNYVPKLSYFKLKYLGGGAKSLHCLAYDRDTILIYDKRKIIMSSFDSDTIIMLYLQIGGGD